MIGKRIFYVTTVFDAELTDRQNESVGCVKKRTILERGPG